MVVHDLKVKNQLESDPNFPIEESEIASIIFTDEGYAFEHVLKTIKWLFIEQDITYWNWSGRAMLYSAITRKIQET